MGDNFNNLSDGTFYFKNLNGEWAPVTTTTTSDITVSSYSGNCKLYSYSPNLIDKLPKISKVIFNDPATIVIWADKTKTVVKCTDGEAYNPMSGLAICVMKKALGDKEYHKAIKKWVKPKEKEETDISKDYEEYYWISEENVITGDGYEDCRKAIKKGVKPKEKEETDISKDDEEYYWIPEENVLTRDGYIYRCSKCGNCSSIPLIRCPRCGTKLIFKNGEKKYGE